MKTLYLDCGMGAAGDMLTAALLELVPDKDGFISRINGLGIPGTYIACEKSAKCGIMGTHVTVTVNGEEEESLDLHHDDRGHEHAHSHEHAHHHTSMRDIEHLIGKHLDLPDKVRLDALNVYRLIAEAESHAHGVPVDQIHFHEVGTMDAVADIVGVCLLMNELAPEQVVVSPIHVGSGQVRCAHGILPVPAPATAYILKDTPIYGGAVKGELCTPTGAALLKHFAARFGDMPVMTVSAVGYGMGKKDFEAANCVRAFLGDTADGMDDVNEICCNLDDMTPEAIGFAEELLFTEGALDVYTIPIGMKRSRPGVMLCCMCHEDKTKEMTDLMLRHTATLGVRVIKSRRFTLSRTQDTVKTAYGPVRVKRAIGKNFAKSKPEYEDVAKIAKENGMSFSEVVNLLRSL